MLKLTKNFYSVQFNRINQLID